MNLTFMCLVWFTVSYNFILIGFSLKYFPGNLYTNAYAMSLSELLSYLLSGYIYSKFGMRKTFISFSILSSVAGFLMIAEHKNTQSWLFPILILFAKFG